MSDVVPRPVLFLDFDGTISRADVVDAILERHAGGGWLIHEEQWRAGRIGSRECLARQMALVSASPSELDALIDGMELDEGFPALLDTCAAHALPVYIISDGFDYCIERLLARLTTTGRSRTGIRQVCASHLEHADGVRWATGFPHARGCDHGCATCKPAVMRALNPSGALALFAGDGLSDRYAAAAADIVFAKGTLARWCDEQRIPYLSYTHLGEVADCLEAEMAGGLLGRSAGVARARA